MSGFVGRTAFVKTDMSSLIPLLQAQKLSRHFGGLIAVNEVEFEVQTGEIVGLIGPNGAGKTTLFNMAWIAPR